MADKSIVYKMAFSFLKGMNVGLLREIEISGISPEEFFTIPTKELISKLKIRHNHEFDKLSREEAVILAQKEWDLIKNHNISPLFLLDDNYPPLLSETPEPPIILYKLGDTET